MRHLNNEQKAKIYDSLLNRFQKLQEEARQIRARNFELSAEDQRRVNFLEQDMRRVYNEAQKLF